MKKIILMLLLAASSMLNAELITITCDFYTCATPSGIEPAGKGFIGMRFVFDTNGSGKGVMLGNAGESDVMVVADDKSITFIQIAPIITTTTINTGTLKAVHSRNTILMGELLPSQYYGKARVN